jgi:predicted transcriptional regulator
MTTLTVAISDELSQRLIEVAQRTGVTPEELARLGLEQWLARPSEDFDKVARYVFKKNAELYRRLA